MVTEILMPKWGWEMKNGTVTKWFKKEGDQVEEGQVVVEAETEKTTGGIEAPASGILRKIVAPAGTVVDVAGVLGIIAEDTEELPTTAAAAPTSAPKVVSEATEAPEAAGTVVEAREAEGRIRITPVARKLAEEHKIDITKIKGTGPSGRITREDIEQVIAGQGKVAAAAPAAMAVSTEKGKVIPLTGLRKIIAERMSRSARTTARVILTVETDATEIVKLRKQSVSEANEQAQISYNDILIKASAKALQEFPAVNSIFEGEQIRLIDEVNVGLAVSIKDGLIVPVVRDANKKTIAEISALTKELIEKARTNSLHPPEMTNGTFTVSNLGMYDVDVFSPIINPPETSILGVGKIAEKPVVREGKITVAPMMYLSLSFDHRVIDGAMAAQFLQRIKALVENPYQLLI